MGSFRLISRYVLTTTKSYNVNDSPFFKEKNGLSTPVSEDCYYSYNPSQ